ncbi:MAG: hypothetical protein A2V70_07430 [Planctomycetes bacterium RBG_13_63_9]|nr:MAG: hypothetical protein A2V70_07430 [Planctomycetes bacterium RBG_13_63_9]
MLLGEPARTQADLNFSLFGIPVRVHPFFWLISVLLGASNNDVRGLLSWVVAVFVSILLHELGHALVMRVFGFRPSITLYGMGGFASYNDSSGYGSAQLHPLRQILICLAGPGAGFLLAAAVVGAVVLSGRPVALNGPWIVTGPIGSFAFTLFIGQLLFINILWGLVNLLPVYPLDGGQIAREILLQINAREGIRLSLMLSVFTAVAMAVYGLTQWQSVWVALLFGYMAYTSYTTLQAYSGRGRWQ